MKIAQLNKVGMSEAKGLTIKTPLPDDGKRAKARFKEKWLFTGRVYREGWSL